MSEIKVADLFSGCGGFRVGFEKTSNRFKTVFSCEIDKYAVSVYNKNFNEDNKISDITKLKTDEIPDIDLLCGGSPCFAKETLITTTRGLIPIEDVVVGDMILTHMNRFRKVKKTMCKQKKGIYNVKVSGSPKILVTEEHPFYVRNMIGLFDSKKGKYKRYFSNPKWIKTEELREDDFLCFGNWSDKYANNSKNLTKEECWLLGRYVADGYIINGKRKGRKNSHHHKVVFCIGKHKLDSFKSKIKKYHIGINEERTAFKCVIINERFMNLCLECGKGAENKKIPFFIMNLQKNLLEKFLDGYISGDGWEKDGKYKASSVSKILIYQLSQVVSRVYSKHSSIYFHKKPKTAIIEGRVVNQKDAWSIGYTKTKRAEEKGIFIRNAWNRFKKKTFDKNWSGKVYNLEVEEDNSYCANGVIVHNCTSFSLAGKRKGLFNEDGSLTSSGLYFELLKIVDAKKPKIVFLENVKGMLSNKSITGGYSFDNMMSALNSIGYVIDFTVLNSKYFKVAQSRERVFVFAIREDLIRKELIIKNEEIKELNVELKTRKRLLNSNIKMWKSPLHIVKLEEGKNDRVILSEILEKNVEDKYYLSGNTVESLIKHQKESKKINDSNSIKYISNSIHQTYRVISTEGLSETLQAGHRSNIIDIKKLGNINKSKHGMSGKVFHMSGVSPTVSSGPFGKVFLDNKLMKPFIRNPYNGKTSEIETGTLGTSCGTSTGKTAQHLYENNKIRKLTPIEVERLQGFSDNFTEKGIYNNEEIILSNNQRYKMMGNAVTTNVISTIAEKLIKYIKF